MKNIELNVKKDNFSEIKVGELPKIEKEFTSVERNY